MKSFGAPSRPGSVSRLGCPCSAQPPATMGASGALGEPFAMHQSWATGLSPFRAVRRAVPAPAEGLTRRRYKADGSVLHSTDGLDVDLGSFGLNVPDPRTQAGRIANAAVARLMWIRKPSAEAHIRWGSATGQEPFIWRIHAPTIARENVIEMVRRVLDEKGGQDVTVEEVPGPDHDPSQGGLPGWHLRVYPTSAYAPPPAPAVAGLGAAEAARTAAGNSDGTNAMATYAPLVAKLLQQAFETPPNERAEVLAAKIKGLEARRSSVPAFLQPYMDQRIAILRARLVGADHERKLASESEAATRRFRWLGYALAGTAVVGLLSMAAFFGVGSRAVYVRTARQNRGRRRRGGR